MKRTFNVYITITTKDKNGTMIFTGYDYNTDGELIKNVINDEIVHSNNFSHEIEETETKTWFEKEVKNKVLKLIEGKTNIVKNGVAVNIMPVGNYNTEHHYIVC